MIAGRKLDCPSCGGSLEVRAAGYTTTVACRYCGSVIDVTNPDAKLIAQYHEMAANLAIPLGTRGALDGVEWEAIGWQSRHDSSGETWEEFLLFNPYAGYHWLVCDQGEWTFGRALVERPDQVSAEVVHWQGKAWEIDGAPEPYTTTRVVGEFYWRVKVGDVVTGATFWSGDQQLSLERNQDEENWTLLAPLSADEVGKAFGIALDRPDGGTGPASPSSGRPWTGPGDDRAFMLTAIVTSMLAFMLTVFGGSGSILAASQDIRVPVDATGRAMTIGPITVTRAYQPVIITAQATDGFVNKWVDLDYHLVDRATHQAVGASTTVDHYEGHDSDGYWREGNYSTTAMIGGVPRGSYDLVVEAEAHTWTQGMAAPAPTPDQNSTADGSWTTGNGPAIPITVSASVGGMLWGNFWTVVVLVFGPAVILLWWHYRGARMS